MEETACLNVDTDGDANTLDCSFSSVPCVLCEPGYSKPGMAGRCEFCGVGRQDTEDRRTCEQCPDGMISTDSLECESCPGGQRPNAVQSGCTSCTFPLYFNEQAGGCTKCPAGTELTELDSNSDSASPCSPCDVGACSIHY
jgi:hypothetical protein